MDETTPTIRLCDLRLEDEYTELTEHFLRYGKGRRPAAPTVRNPTNRILLQLHCMKDDSGSSWDV
ncbi:hypothetical protein ElyMa_002826600, partial [Elysia marginata]